MPRPTMLPPPYGYPSYSMGYPQQQHVPQFPNLDAPREEAQFPRQQAAPQFVNEEAAADNNAASPKSDQPTTTAIAPKKKKSKHDEDPTKKPPRPYTEYNIFFQLERERILVDLEKQNHHEQHGYIPQEEVTINRPSDDNDILPRPPRFAHLHLSPKWYDSKHRLAENRKNKEKRKHRKTHGLVGFLDLTKRIAKAWSEADDDVKAYCKKVARRQLGFYKEELKVWKKDMEAKSAEKIEVDATAVAAPVAAPPSTMAAAPSVAPAPKMPELPAADTAKLAVHPQVIHRSMPPPPAQHHYHPHHAQRNMHWQPNAHQHHYMTRNYPIMPALSPSMDYHDDYRYRPMPISNRHPLDELMHRRNLYGSRTAQMQPVRKRKNDLEPNRVIKGEEIISPSDRNVKETKSFLSPEDTAGDNDANAAITPSPSSRCSGQNEHLPMKKRRKKTDDFADVSPGSIGGSPGDNADLKLSPFNFSPSEGMIMTPNGDAFTGQMMGMSPSLGQWNNESPFPYIDCFSPQEGAATKYPGDNAVYRRPSVASMYPQSPYLPPASYPSQSSYPFDGNMNDGDFLDLDDEEMQLMRRLHATRAKKLRQRHHLMQQHAVGSKEWACAAHSPGAPMIGNYSFASPVDKTGSVKK